MVKTQWVKCNVNQYHISIEIYIIALIYKQQLFTVHLVSYSKGGSCPCHCSWCALKKKKNSCSTDGEAQAAYLPQHVPNKLVQKSDGFWELNPSHCRYSIHKAPLRPLLKLGKTPPLSPFLSTGLVPNITFCWICNLCRSIDLRPLANIFITEALSAACHLNVGPLEKIYPK